MSLPVDPSAVAVPGAAARSTGVTRRLLATPLGLASVAVLGALVVVALTAPWLAPADPAAGDLASAFQGPSAAHLLGDGGRLSAATSSRASSTGRG